MLLLLRASRRNVRTRAGGSIYKAAAAAASELPSYSSHKPLHQRKRLDEFSMFDEEEEEFFKIKKQAKTPQVELPSTSANINQEIKRFAGDLQQLESFLTQKRNLLEEFDYVNCATAMHLLGKHRSKNRELADQIIKLSSQQEFRTRELSNLAHGVASGSFSSKMPDFVSEQAVASMGKFSSQALSMLLWSYARMNHRDRKLLNAVCKEIFQNRKTTVALNKEDVPSAQSLANILWSLSVLQPDEHKANARVCPVLCQDVLRALMDPARKDTFLPQTLAMIVSSLATLKHKDDQVMELIQDTLLDFKSYKHFNEQAIGTILLGYAKLGKSAALCKRFDPEVRYRLRTFIPAGLGNVCEAFARMEYASPELWDRLLVEINTRKDDHQFTPHVVAQMLYATSRSNNINPQLVNAVTKKLAMALVKREFKQVALSDLILATDAFAVMRYKDDVFLSKATRALFAKRSEFKRQVSTNELVSLCVALIQMNAQPDQEKLFDLCAMDACTRNVEEFTLEEQVDMLWSFACLDRADLFTMLLEKFGANIAAAGAQATKPSRKLAEITLFAALNKIPCAIETVMEPKQQQDEHPFAVEAMQEVTHEFFQVFPDVQQNATVCGLRMDVFVPSRKLCIEINGPECFFQNGLPTGPSLFRHRMLRQQGYQVFSIPREIFASMDKSARQAEILKLIKKQQVK